MRVDDIRTAKQLPDGYRTDGLYLPKNKSISEMTHEEAVRGLCHRAGGDPRACITCPAPCGIGRRLVELMEAKEAANAPQD